MLELKNITKSYRMKKGVTVAALKDVSFTLPEKGMVFLLGKSGSGKSTLLHILGGLDTADSGEILLRGKSMQHFSQAEYDSYRNTLIGFIFQEYNLLNDFTVGANIALALELQGKKATDEAVNAILREVDLNGLGARRPNELSGGQKQRVAIARALIKSPEILMADEPTGALDSQTGRQVLETLRRLAETRLVIVVSHDREFAEQYGDRILELADGAVIRDVSREAQALPPVCREDEIVLIRRNYTLTETDLKQINDYLASGAGKVAFGGESASFAPTLPQPVAEEPKEVRFIRSRLPFRDSFRLGASGLKHKKIRLVLTIFLSVVAFTLFALSDTMAAYNHTTAVTDSVLDGNFRYASVECYTRMDSYDYFYYRNAGIDEKDIAEISAMMPGHTWLPVRIGNTAYNVGNPEMLVPKTASGERSPAFYEPVLSGFAPLSEGGLREIGALIAGTLPEDNTQAVVTAYTFEVFRIAGYLDENGKAFSIQTPDDLLGKKLADYTVCGVVDTALDTSPYAFMMPESTPETTEGLNAYLLFSEVETLLTKSPHRLLYLSEDAFTALIRERSPVYVANYVELSVTDDAGNQINDYLDTAMTPDNTVTCIRFDASDTVLNDGEIFLPEYTVYRLKGENIPDSPFDVAAVTSSGRAKTLKVVGYTESEVAVVSETTLLDLGFYRIRPYDCALAGFPDRRSEIFSFVKALDATEGEPTFYQLVNPASDLLENVNSFIEEGASVFFWIGLFFAVFAALLLANFIAVSISYKKRDIGVLRALGARGADVFAIFFNESLLIAAINWVLSTVSCALLVTFLNGMLRSDYGLIITILSFSFRQVFLLMGISLLVAFAASFLPVYRSAHKKPIDAIRK